MKKGMERIFEFCFPEEAHHAFLASWTGCCCEAQLQLSPEPSARAPEPGGQASGHRGLQRDCPDLEMRVFHTWASSGSQTAPAITGSEMNGTRVFWRARWGTALQGDSLSYLPDLLAEPGLTPH